MGKDDVARSGELGGGGEAADSRHSLPVAREAQPTCILPSHFEIFYTTHTPSDSDGRRPLLVEGRTVTGTASLLTTRLLSSLSAPMHLDCDDNAYAITV